ncbi:sugar phosphate isomerase/epimerase [Paenibacillus filicis]|uniref:Sugar phosphate isomerase/epimerase n=1 Tax=Paenibacillus filicis TaxID=669464 RepID=A0ABU9DLH6_9BACL
MKYAFNSASCPELSLDELIQTARIYDYQGLELRSGIGHRHGVELTAGQMEKSRLRTLLADSEIEICCLSISNTFSKPVEVGYQIGETMSYLELASSLSIPNVRVFCGRIPADGSRETSRESIIDALYSLGEVAGDCGVRLVVETHDHWSDPRLMAEIMREVNRPQVAVAWDVIHTEREGQAGPEEVYETLGPWIQHVHFHDGLRRLDRLHYRPIGTGEFDQLRIARVLVKAGYQGYVSGEWYNWEPYEIHLPRELAAWKRFVSLAESEEVEHGV